MIPRSFNINRIKFFYLLVSILGLSLIGIEIYLNSHNTSICKTEGCILVHIFDNYGVLNYIGFAIFFYLFLIALLDIFNFFLGFLLKLRTYILALSIVVEGYFLGFQSWYLKAYCDYCLIIAGFLFLAFFLDYLYPEKSVALLSVKKEKKASIYKISILGFFSVFLATFLVHFSLKPLNLDLPVIIYEKGCPHCREVISYAKKNNIKIKLYSVKSVISLMKIFDIHTVPLLIDREGKRLVLLKGENEIKNWFNNKYKIKKEEVNDKKAKRKDKVRLRNGKNKLPKKRKTSYPVDIQIFKSSNIPLNTTSDTKEESGACSIDKPCE